MKTRRSLHAKLLIWLGGYVVLLTGVVMLQGFIVSEFVEDVVRKSVMSQELERHLERRASDPDHRWYDTDAMQLYGLPERAPPPVLSALAEGVHNGIWMDGREIVALVRQVRGVRYVMVLDVTEPEAREDTLIVFLFGLSLVLVLVLGVLIAWGLRRSLGPLSSLARDIGALAPDCAGQRIVLGDSATSELQVIADALNDYLHRYEVFVERERVFNDTASHELRTPIAVIAGASELALEQPGLPANARQQVQRILHTARGVEQLIALLLTLAKDPARLARASDTVQLHKLLPEIIDDHRHLLQDKALTIVVDGLAPCTVEAPPHIVQAAIGNLLRNAIENSDRGVIRVRLDADATVTIEDPGHGMTHEEISRIYAQMARQGGREGIGLDLLGRLCEHLGWRLTITSTPGSGTLGRLRL